MKTKFSRTIRGTRWLLTTAAAVIASAISTSASANELVNSGFENGTTAWTLQPNHSVVSSNARSGTRSLELTSNAAVSSTFSNRISANSGDEFVYSAYVKAQNLTVGPGTFGETPLMVLRMRNGFGYVLNHKGKRTEGYRWVPYTPSGTFGYTNSGMQMRFQMTQEGDSFDVGVRTWKHNLSGKTWWDDLSVTRLSFPDRGAVTGTFQAESANTINRAAIRSIEHDYTGSGYVDVTATNATVTWNNVPGGGQRVLSFRYSWEGFIQNFTVFVNGQQIASEKPTATGRRGLWATKDFNVNLPSGNNTVSIQIGKRGGELGAPMLDKMTVYVKSGSGGGNPPPPPPPPPPATPDAPANVTASDSAHTDRVSISWNASANADNYQLYRNTNTSGQGTRIYLGNALSFNDTDAVPAVNYQYRARACNSAGCGAYSPWDAGSRADTGGGGGPGGGGEPPPSGNGSVSAVVANSATVVDISDGTADWLKPGATTVRKANAAEQISAITGIGNTNGHSYRFARRGHSWIGGTPVLTATNNRSGVRVFNNDKGLKFSVAASTAPRTLSFWVTGSSSNAESFELAVTAALSDNSASPYTTTVTRSGGGTIGRRIDVTYMSESDNETIEVELLKNGGNYFSLDAISVTGGDGASINLPPTLAAIADQTITEGETLYVDINAEDPEGSDLTLSFSSELPRSGNLTDSGNGIGSIDWESMVGDAGSYEVMVTAQDAANNSTSVSFTVNVSPQSEPGTDGILAVSANILSLRNVTLQSNFAKFAPSAQLDIATDSAGAQTFEPVIALGGALGAHKSFGRTRYTYGGSNPGSAVKGGNRIYDPSPKGMRLEIDTSQLQSSTRIYFSVVGARARAVIALSDGSHPQEIIEFDRLGKSLQTFAIDVDHASGSANQKLVLEFFIDELTTPGSGWIQLEAAEDRSNL